MFNFPSGGGDGRLLNVQAFSASGTYTPTAGTRKALVILAGATGGGASATTDDGTAGGTTSFGSHVSCTGGAAGLINTAHMDGVRAAASGSPTGQTSIIGKREGGYGGAGYDGGGQWRHGQHGGGAPVVAKWVTSLGATETVTIGAAGAASSGASQDGMAGLAGSITVLEYA